MSGGGGGGWGRCPSHARQAEHAGVSPSIKNDKVKEPREHLFDFNNANYELCNKVQSLLFKIPKCFFVDIKDNSFDSKKLELN